MPQIRCPICGAMFDFAAAAATAPFCSPRCKQIDLGRWLGEKYSVPVKREEEEESEEPREEEQN